jgi:hypothetical protein
MQSLRILPLSDNRLLLVIRSWDLSQKQGNDAVDCRVDSFLLIVRTGRIFTTRSVTLNRGKQTDEYRQILGCPSI